MNASSPPFRSNASSVSLIKSPIFSRRCWPYSIPSPKFAFYAEKKAKFKDSKMQIFSTYNSNF